MRLFCLREAFALIVLLLGVEG